MSTPNLEGLLQESAMGELQRLKAIESGYGALYEGLEQLIRDCLQIALLDGAPKRSLRLLAQLSTARDLALEAFYEAPTGEEGQP